MDESVKRIFETGNIQMLMGQRPRHVFDVLVHNIPVDDGEVLAARTRVADALETACAVADRLERTVDELTCIEDGGLSGGFRRLIATAILAVQITARSRSEANEPFRAYLLATHRAAAERWRDGSYDLSNCLGAVFNGLLVERDPADTLGGWIWSNLGLEGDTEYYFRWVLSSRRFQNLTGDEIVRRIHDEAVRAFRRIPRLDGISRKQAKRIVERRLSEQPYPGATGAVYKVVSFDEIKDRIPIAYVADKGFWQRQWIAYLERSEVGLISSLIMAINRRTGQVGYTGSAGDEG